MTQIVLPGLSDTLIKEFLETIPLYTWREYSRKGFFRSNLWIEAIDDYCENCEQIRPFHDMKPRGSGVPPGAPTPKLQTERAYFTFKCVTCKKAERVFLVEQIITDDTVKIQKYGELPRRRFKRDRVTEKFFKKDLEDYEKAVICLSHGYGIASFAYFRRIVENNIQRILDEVLEDANATGHASALVASINELKKESPMSDRIKIANQALPSHLIPNGFNPLGALYQALSEGVHNLPDEICLQKAESVNSCLAFLISELASRKESRAKFKATLAKLKI
jgi:hypothetical protein